MKRKTDIPKPLLAFIIVNLIMGFDLGFVKYLKGESKIVCHLIQLPMILTVSYMLFKPSLLDVRLYICIAVGIQYVFNIFIFKLSKYNVFDMIDDIIGIDVNVLSNESRISISALIATVFTYSLEITCIIVLFFYDLEHLHNSSNDILVLIVFVCSFASDIIAIVKMLVFYYIYKSLVFLKQVIKIQSNNLETVIEYYIEIIDIYDKIMPLYEKLLISAVAVNMTRVILDMWDVAKGIREDEMWIFIGGRSFYLMNTFLKFWGPAIIAEMCNSKIKDFKQIVNDRWSMEEDKQKKEQMLNWFNYIECRNLQYKVCGVLPIDLRLVIALAQFAITHLIVLLQFTHVV